MERIVDREANQALWARFTEVQGQYDRMRDGLVDLQHRMRRLRVTVMSADELVTATVDARAQVISVELDPQVYREKEPRELAATITETIRRAAAQATGQVTELMSNFLPAGAGATDFLRSGDFGDLLRSQDAATGYDQEVHNGR